MIGCAELDRAVAAARSIFAQLRNRYPDLKAYLVLCRGDQQTELSSNPLDILNASPQVVVDSIAKREALRLLAEKKKAEANGGPGASAQNLSRELDARLHALHFAPDTQIEIRFADLRYRLVWALQQDPLVDRARTPQTKASIRIVLGSLETLSRQERTDP